MSCPERMSDCVNRFSASVEMVCLSSFILLMCCITLTVFHMMNHLASMTKKKKRKKTQITKVKNEMHETSARAWCIGKTQRDQVEREVGGGIGMRNTCKSMADSCQCMAKTTKKKQRHYFAKKKKKRMRQGIYLPTL